jgi:streptogramin lyase
MIHRCAACHSLGVLGGKRLSEDAWAKIVDRMAHKEPPGRGEADTLAPWEQNPWSRAAAVLVKQFAPGREPYRYEPFPIKNDLDHLAKVVVKEYRLRRPETNVHDIAVESTGKRVWYDDQESGEATKTGWFGWYDPATGESKEYQVPQCPGFGGRILSDKVGRIWAGCTKALAYWSPDTDKLTIFPMDKYGMRELWAIDSHGDAYTILRGRNVDPDGDPKYSFIGKFDTKTQEWTLFKVPTPWGNPYEVIPDSKDNIWFTEIATDKIGKLDPRTGKITEYDVPTKGGNPRRFAIDSKDNIWFTEYSGNKIGMLDSRTGQVTDYEAPTPNSIPYACGVDKNDVVWFSEIGAMRVGRFDPKTKTFREYPVPYKLASIKNINFTYAKDKQVVWGSDRTGPNIIGMEVPTP